MLKLTKQLSFYFFGVLLLMAGCADKTNNNSSYSINDNKKLIFTFLGAPGAGKGTLSQQGVNQLGFEVLSTGDLCRQHITNKTNLGKEIEKYTCKGDLVPDSLIVKMVQEWLMARKEKEIPIILDGFPRTVEQAQKLVDLIKTDMPKHNFRIIKLDISQKEITKRLVDRRVCSNKKCNAVYNLSMPGIKQGICPKCASPLIQREDDKTEIIAKRFDVYNKHENELITFFEKEGYSVEHLNASQLTPIQIFENFRKII